MDEAKKAAVLKELDEVFIKHKLTFEDVQYCAQYLYEQTASLAGKQLFKSAPN